MSRSRVLEILKETTFVVVPPDGDVFTADAAAGLVGRTTVVRRLDGSTVEAEIVGARLCPDGRVALTVAVPGGIDRAPKAEDA